MAENDAGAAGSEGTAAAAAPAAEEARVTGVNEAGEQVTEGEEAAATETEAAAAEGETEGEETAAEGEEAKPKKRPWWQKRIDELTREKHEAVRAKTALEMQLQKPAEGEEQRAQPDAAQLTEAEIERRAEAKATTRAAEKSFADACNAVYDKGVEIAGDEDAWKDALGNYQTLVGDRFRDVTSIALATDDPSKVIMELGKDPDEAERILKLPPARMAIEMDRLARGRKTVKPVSKAPAPIRPVGGTGGGADPLRDDAPMDVFAPAFMERLHKHLNS